MLGYEFTWDPEKARTNLLKHEVGFDEAVTAFEDLRGLLIDDPEHSQTEDRYILLGLSVKLRLVVISHLYRQDDTEIRIISARLATKNERNDYWSRL